MEYSSMKRHTRDRIECYWEVTAQNYQLCYQI